jgi:hypothetical protein
MYDNLSSFFSIRHRRRKIATNSASFGMSVEVHNEGIVIMTKSTETDHSNSSGHKKNNEFIPWGAKARKILCSIMFGEIPDCSEIDALNLHCSGKRDLDGGMIRCIVTDMRTSCDTAICQRAESFVGHLVSKNGDRINHLTKQRSVIRKQIAALTSQCNSTAKAEDEAMTAEQAAVVAHQGSQDTWNLFKLQAQHFFANGK